MSLPALAPTADPRTSSERVNVLIREYNREDTFTPIFAVDTGTATAYAVAPVPGIVAYKIGQIFIFKASHANTTAAPTLNVNGLGAGTITYSDGSALAVGDIALNGFYTVEVTSTTPTFSLMTPTKNRLLQTVSTETGVKATGTHQIPVDDTKPDQSVPEGDEYMTLTINRKSASSTLIIDVNMCLATDGAATTLVAALFQDSTALALAAIPQAVTGANNPQFISYRHVMASGATGNTTLRAWAGFNAAGTTTFNGIAGGRVLGGAVPSSLVIQEVLP